MQSYFIKSALLLDRDRDAGLGAHGVGVGGGTFDHTGSMAYLDLHAGLTDQSRAAQLLLNQPQQQIMTPLGMGNSSGGRIPAGFMAGLNYASTQNLMVLSTGGGVQNPLQSNFMIEVDEFKFAKIITSVVQRQSQPLKPEQEQCDDSCSLSDEYDEEEETELSDKGAKTLAADQLQLAELDWNES